jgi:hypothetical protein
MASTNGDKKLSLALFDTKANPDYRCKLCNIIRKLRKPGGYTNTLDHLNDKYKKWSEVLERAKSKNGKKGLADLFLVHDKNFENAIVKLQGPREAVLSPAEKEAVKVFKSAPGDGGGVQQEAILETHAQKVLREEEKKRNKKAKNSEYRPVHHVASNSNRCERLFSGMKLVMNDQRKCMDPFTLENSDFWDARDIQEIALAAKCGRRDDEGVRE